MKAELKHISGFLPFELEIETHLKNRYIIDSKARDGDDDSNTISVHSFFKHGIPVLHPLENLVKEIEFEGKKIRPMFELLKLASKQETIPSETIEYSINEKAYFIRVNYRGFYVILAYDDEDKSFRMIRNDKIVSVANQLEMFEMLFKWHFNVYSVESINK